MKSLSEIFSEENERHGQTTPFKTMSALPPQGGYTKDATADLRLKIFNQCGILGKILRKPDGSQFSSNELFAMPIDELEALFDRTPADPDKASQFANANAAMMPKGLGDGTKPMVCMAAIFDAESACLKLLSARIDSSRDSKEDKERFTIIRRFIAENRLPLKADGFTYFTDKELADMQLSTLRLLANNTQPSTRVI
jgi:hypothetical protein